MQTIPITAKTAALSVVRKAFFYEFLVYRHSDLYSAADWLVGKECWEKKGGLKISSYAST